MKLTFIFLFFCINQILSEEVENSDIKGEQKGIITNRPANIIEDTRTEEEKLRDKEEKAKQNVIFEEKIKERYKAIVWEQGDLRQKLVRSELISAGEAHPPSDKYVSLGVIVCNVTIKGMVGGIMRLFAKLIRSIYTYSKGTPIHIVVITDKKSFSIVHSVVVNTIGRFLSETAIASGVNSGLPPWNVLSVFPKTWVEFVDLDSITKDHREIINMMKEEYSLNKEEATDFPISPGPDGTPRVASISPKYSQDLFYIGPFYGYEFKKMNRMIVVDADVVVKEDLIYLHKYFDEMNEDEIMGVTMDTAGYYYHISRFLDKRSIQLNTTYFLTDDEVKKRGLNTGVVLYNLEKIRNSKLYKELLVYDKIKDIKTEIGLKSETVQIDFQLGDQDYLNLLMWRNPQLFKALPCEWNVQDSPVMVEVKHECKAKAKIHHKHGDIHDNEVFD